MLPLLVLTRRIAAQVKTSTGNNFLDVREFPELVPVLVLNFGDVPALQYCTGNFVSASSIGLRSLYVMGLRYKQRGPVP